MNQLSFLGELSQSAMTHQTQSTCQQRLSILTNPRSENDGGEIKLRPFAMSTRINCHFLIKCPGCQERGDYNQGTVKFFSHCPRAELFKTSMPVILSCMLPQTAVPKLHLHNSPIQLKIYMDFFFASSLYISTICCNLKKNVKIIYASK